MGQLPINVNSRTDIVSSWLTQTRLHYPTAWSQLIEQTLLRPARGWARFLGRSAPPSLPPPPTVSTPSEPPSEKFGRPAREWSLW